MAKKKRFGDILREKLDFPVGCAPSESSVEIMGKKRVIVRGCRGINEYGENLISVDVHEGVLEISGRGLYCTAYMSGAIEISGKIDSVEFGEECRCR